MTAAHVRGTAIEGVVILGMHRSGTSVVTRLVSLLGLALCRPEDLLAGFPGNPRGHWESKSLIALNNRLLRQLDGSWYCPPSLEPERISSLLEPHAAAGLAALRHAHPRWPFVWKDPRTCILMPFWSNVLGPRAAYVLVARHPGEVSDSLERRNGFAPEYGVALWERYTRLAISGCAGRATMVCTYDEVLTEPIAWCERMAGFLRSLKVEVPVIEEATISAFVTSSLRRARRSWQDLEPARLYTDERRTLVEASTRVGARAAYLPPPLPPESPETEVILNEIRGSIAGKRPHSARLAAVPAHFVRPASAARPAEDSRPLATAIVIGEGASLKRSIAALERALPAGSEVQAVPGGRHGIESPETRPDGLRGGRGAPPPGAARHGGSEALARALDAAAGRIVLISTGEPPAGDSWFADVQKELKRSAAGALGAAVRFAQESDRMYLGSKFVKADLSRAPVTGAGAKGLASVPLLVGGLCAFDRRVLTAAGGIDGEFDTVSSALAELSLRLWRMCFPSYAAPRLEVCVAGEPSEEANGLYDRLRIATLHLEEVELRAFIGRARRDPSYDSAAERLAATDVRQRRALTDAVCAFPTERYFEEFPLRGGRARSKLLTVRRLVAGWARHTRLPHLRRWSPGREPERNSSVSAAASAARRRAGSSRR